MKKILIIVGISSLLFFILRAYYTVKTNLVFYSVYYARNLNHNPTYNPTMAMIVDNLDYIPRPENDLIKYDFDGHSTIHSKRDDIFLTGTIEEYMLFQGNDIYSFTGQGEFSEFRMLGNDANPSENSEGRKRAKNLSTNS